jgi:hypothetical protein
MIGLTCRSVLAHQGLGLQGAVYDISVDIVLNSTYPGGGVSGIWNLERKKCQNTSSSAVWNVYLRLTPTLALRY